MHRTIYDRVLVLTANFTFQSAILRVKSEHLHGEYIITNALKHTTIGPVMNP